MKITQYICNKCGFSGKSMFLAPRCAQCHSIDTKVRPNI